MSTTTYDDGVAFAARSSAIAELASLSPMDYDRVREAAAATIGVRTATLDAEVRRVRGAGKTNHLPPAYSDDALALAFSDRYGDELRYVAGWSRWLAWNGRFWKSDNTLQVFDRARGVCREAAAECGDSATAATVSRAATVTAVERLARGDRRHASTPDDWDNDPWQLNTPSGIVDLKSGVTLPHRPDACMTKITAVGPSGACPLWREFLARVTNQNVELQAFLQRVAGHCLTGSVREHALFFIYGLGGNGKGVFLNTLSAILGDYAATASIDVFTASQNDRHPTDLAMLRGARLVTAQETEEGRRWAESRIKALTGGDPITARFMRQDFFTYDPQFTLIIAGNHKPGLRNVDEAIRRRLHLIPFDVKIAAAERDPDLPEKLKAEWSGILQWAIDGCLAWQREGLANPAVVAAATETYFEGEDAVGQWLSECCTTGKSHQCASSTLFASWAKWAEQAGEHAGSQKRFSQTLVARGFKQARLGDGKAAFVGLQAAIASASHWSDG